MNQLFVLTIVLIWTLSSGIIINENCKPTQIDTPNYKLTYFNGRGRAEVSRLIFAQAGVPYQDNRISKEDWPKLKPTMPFLQVPVLEVDGTLIPQSKAIGRYLARQFGLCGKNDIEAALCDGFVDQLDDVTEKWYSLNHEKDSDKRKDLWTTYQNNTLNPLMALFDKSLTNTGTGYLVGKQLTWADIVTFNILQSIQTNNTDIMDGYPKLQAFMTKVADMPNIKAWIEKRPKTEN